MYTVIKNLRVKEEAYKYLASQKREGESFSDVILRMKQMQRKEALRALCGSCPDIEDRVQEMRSNWR